MKSKSLAVSEDKREKYEQNNSNSEREFFSDNFL